MALLAAAIVPFAQPALASCNQIPGTVEVFRGASGSANRPFAGPGDFVELRPGTACHPETGRFDADPAAHVVSVVFTPHSGRPSLIALAADCSAVSAELTRCARRHDLANATCVPHAATAVESFERDGERRLRFRFPDTDALLHGADDDRSLAGPASLAVSAAGEPLPCDLASRRCREHDDLSACIDELFELDGTCGSTPHPQFPHFTALPPPNDFQALCIEPSPPCTGRQSELRFTTDAAGNLLLPVDWRGVLLGEAVPVARLLRGASSVPAFPDGDAPIRIPGRSFLRSFSPNGGPLPPIFEPQADPGAPGELTLFGSADAAQTVLFVSRRSSSWLSCHGGERDGRPCNQASECPSGSCGASVCRDDPAQTCTADGDCSGGECGAALFDFASRALDGVGPVVLPRDGSGACQTSGTACRSSADCDNEPCVAFRLRAEDPVPLEGLIESPTVFVSVVPEAIAGRDLNGDSDRTDNVVLLHDRQSGVRQPIGERAAPGRAATRLNQPPFLYSAVTAEDDLVAILEAEPLQGSGDANGDGDQFDSILRVFRSQADGADEITRGLDLAVEAGPLVSGRSVVISRGAVFFRAAEAAQGRRRLRRVSVSSTGAPSDGTSSRPVLSGDGRHVGFESTAASLAPDASAAASNVYLHDRATGATSVLRIDSAITVAPSPARDASLSGDGRYVAAAVVDDAEVSQIFVHDRDTDEDGIFDESDAVRSTLISVNSFDERAERDSYNPALSADGRFVAFNSLSSGLVRENPEGSQPFEVHARTLLHDRDPDEDGRFDDEAAVPKIFLALDVLFQPPSLSRDGGLVAFSSVSDFLLEEENQNDFCINLTSASSSCADPFVRDFDRDATLLGSLSSRSEQGDSASSHAALAANGAALSFDSAASNLAPGDTNGLIDVFVRDFASGTAARVSVGSDGTQANGSSAARVGALSADGRFVVFASDADNLVAGDDNQACGDANCTDVFRHDLLTGFTERISVADDGSQGDGRSLQPFLSDDGEVIAFQSYARNLATADGSEACDDDPDGATGDRCADILVSEPDPAAGGDLNGDGDLADTVLRVLDTGTNPPVVIELGPASEVDTSAGRALYLVPEAELASGSDADRNGDGDALDQVVHLWTRDDGPRGLGLAAIRAVLSESQIAILVSEAEQGGLDRNGDGDADDAVVCIAALASPAACANLEQAADEVRIAGDFVAFLTPEAMQGEDLNGDGDREDRVLQTWDATTGTLGNSGQAAADLVMGPALVAFRTPESEQGGIDLNGDGDSEDTVLQVVDLGTGRVINSGQAATPCRLEACDPRLPFRVTGAVVRFLTLEAEQGEDLDGDGDRADLILQTLTLIPGAARWRAPAAATAQITALGAVQAGVCSDSGDACAGPADCQTPATCYVPPGACVENLGVECTVDLEASCDAGQFCVPDGPGRGNCHVTRGSCVSDADCPAPAQCRDAGSQRHQVIDPLAAGEAVTFTGAGQCIEDSGRRCDDAAATPCPAGEFCTPAAGGERRCERAHGSCATDADCPGPATCRAQLITAVARDSDGDGIPDPFDNCPRLANPGQSDADGDRIGNGCEVAALPTQTPEPDVDATPANPGSAGDGCHIDGRARGLAPWLLLGLLGAAMRARMRRLPILLLAVFTAVAGQANAVETEPVMSCAADCDASGSVTVDEITRLVSQSLGETVMSGCRCADVNGDRAITVDELVAALTDALRGCAAMPPERVARTIVSMVRSLASLHTVAGPVSLGLNGAGPDPEPCPIAGGFENSCSEPTTSSVRIPVEVVACEVDTPEGRGVYDGTVDIVARGACPDLLIPANILMRTRLVGRIENLFSRVGVDTSSDLDILIRRQLSGSGQCGVIGAQATLDGEMRLDHSGDDETALVFDATGVTVRFEELRHDFDCEPGTITAEVDGSIDAYDAVGVGRACTTAVGLNVRRQRRRDLLQIDGMLAAPLAGGAVEIRTVEPIRSRFGDLCLRGGELHVDGAGHSLRLRFEPDGSVAVDGDGIGIVIDDFACGECGDGHLEGNEECDDGNRDAGDGCSDLCVVEACHSCTGSPSECQPAADDTSCDDGLSCTGPDRCEAGACTRHEKPCLMVTDRFAARVFAVDLEEGGARLVSDRNLLNIPGGLVGDGRGQLLVSSDDTAKPFRLLRIDPRTGAQQVIMESTPIVGATSLLAENSGTLLLASPYYGTSGLGGVFRIDPEHATSTLLLESPEGRARAPRALSRLSGDEWLVTYLDSLENLGTDPGHLYRANLATGQQQEIPLDTVLIDPMALAVDSRGRLYLLDNGVDIVPHRLMRVDIESGRTDVIETEPIFGPSNMLFAPDGALLIADRPAGGGRILRLDLEAGTAQQLVGPDRLAHPDGMWIVPGTPPVATTPGK
jgi:cysteine-rich repeat protein